MSLMRQTGLLLVAVMTLALAAAVGVNVLSARETLAAQLRLKNSDNAHSLALALSQQRGEPQLMALLMAAQFDTGFYRAIRLVRSDGSLAYARESEGAAPSAPAWFVAALPIESPAGVAQVSDGWRALGQVEIVSQVGYAHDELWRSGLRTAGLLLAIGVAALLLASAGVRRIRRPLDATVAQAEALVAGRYVQVEQPRMAELRPLAAAMNRMVQTVQGLFEAQAVQVEALRRQAHADPLTGLAHRAHFLQRLQTLLGAEEGGHGVLLMVRLHDLAGLNRSHGRERTDRALRAMAAVLNELAQGSAWAGRMNGADFTLALPTALPGSAAALGAATRARLRRALEALGAAFTLHLGAVEWCPGTTPSALLAQADLALARAEAGAPFELGVGVLLAGTDPTARQGEHEWHCQLSAAIAQQRTHLASYPVVARDGSLWQVECPLRVQRLPGGGFETAAQWLPLAARSRLLPQLDLHAVQLALAAIGNDGVPRGINIALASLADGAFTSGLRQLLRASAHASRQLGLEVGESAATDQFALLQSFASWVRPLGVRFGLEHAGHRLHGIDRLYELGLDYVKLDASLVRGVAVDDAARRFVDGSVALLHALGVAVCAEGVDSAADAQTLWGCGVDSITGPWASAQRPLL